MKKELVIGTRASRLALCQAQYVADCLQERCPGLQVRLEHITTTGDKILDVPLAKIGGKGLFTKELEVAMMEGTIDLAVHSLKDMPTELPEGLVLAAITEREDPGDALVCPQYKNMDNLPQGARVGTSSLRRKAQLLHHRPDLQVETLRGNLDTRMRKLREGQFDAILLAVAGMKRLGWEEHITQVLPYSLCLPAVGQGALAIETRADDQEVRELLQCIHDPVTCQAVTAERSYLHKVEGGCQTPIGVYAQVEEDRLEMEAVILSCNGENILRRHIIGRASEAEWLGIALAERMLADGGQEILDEIYRGELAEQKK